MSRRRDRSGITLQEVEKTAAQIESFAADMELGALLGDELTQRALEGGFMQLNQALWRLYRSDPALALRVPLGRDPQEEWLDMLLRWHDLADPAELWRRAREQAPAVRQAAQAMLDELDREAGAGGGRPACDAREEISMTVVRLHDAARMSWRAGRPGR